MDALVPAPHLPAPAFLVGRERERETLLRLLEDAAAGSGSIALISGPAGIGKTALARELIDTARERGIRILFGACYDGISTAPYEPWHAALIYGRDPRSPTPHDLLAYLGQALPDAGPIDSELALARSLLAALAAGTSDRAGLLVLEDLHWGDTASLALLSRVARAISGLPLLMVATWREDAGSASSGLAVIATLARDPLCTRLELQRLDEAGTAELVRRRYRLAGDGQRRLVELLTRYAEGNPLFVLEILRELELGGQLGPEPDGWRVNDLSDVRVPPIVEQLIAARLAALSPAVRDLLAAGAVLGQSFPYDLWRAISRADDDALTVAIGAAQDAHILPSTGRNDALEFQHAFIREVLYRELTPPVRRDLHSRAATELLSAATPDAHRIAVHLQAAGDERAAAWLLRAGDDAERAHAWQDALECFRQALDVLPALPESERMRGWLSYRIACLLRYSDLGRARDALDDALAIGYACRDRMLIAYARYLRGLLHVYAGSGQRGFDDLIDAIGLLERLPALERLRLNASLGIFNPDALPLPTSRFEPAPDAEGPDGLLRGDIDRRATVASLMAESGRLDEALELLMSWRQAAGGRADQAEPGQAGHIMQTSAYVHALAGRPVDSAADFDEAARMFEDSARPLMLVDCIANRLSVLGWPYQADRIAARQAQLAEARRLAGRLGEFIASGLSHDHWLVLSHYLEGRWDLVERLIAAPVLTVPGGRYHQHNYWVAAMLMRERGRPDDAWAWLRRLLPDAERSEPGNTDFLTSTRAMVLAAELALDAGDAGTAERWLAAHARWMRWSGAMLGAAEADLARARLARVAGDPDAAREHAYRALAGAVEPRQPLAQAAIQRFIAELDVEARDEAAAGEHLDRATALAASCEAPHVLLDCRIALVGLLAARGELGRARELAAEARAAAIDLGAQRLLGLLDAIDLDPTTEADQLTARELEVLQRIALGLTDADVGEQLYIATRTVNAHMRAIRAKLAVDSRLSAVRVARERGLI
jgi:ATP/maltotriose-dependent transcriptional regulator MalT